MPVGVQINRQFMWEVDCKGNIIKILYTYFNYIELKDKELYRSALKEDDKSKV